MVLPKRPRAGHLCQFRKRKWHRRCMICAAPLLLLLLLLLFLLLAVFVWERYHNTNNTNTNINIEARILQVPYPPQRRFPSYGTARFSETCPWISSSSRPPPPPPPPPPAAVPNTVIGPSPCLTYVTPRVDENEGVAEWLSKLVSGYMDAHIRGCQLLLDYGPDIALEQVFEPVSMAVDWRRRRRRQRRRGGPNQIDDQDDCNSKESKMCTNIATRISHNIMSTKQWELGIFLQPSGIHIPNYRHIFRNMSRIYNLHDDQFQALPQALLHGTKEGNPAPTDLSSIGMDVRHVLETGFACSMASILQLANPLAAQFQTNLFTELLPILRDDDAFVLAIYIRSGQTDVAATAEKEGRYIKENVDGDGTTTFETMPEVHNTLACARQLEERALSSSLPSSSSTVTLDIPLPAGRPFSRVVWLLVSDSVPLKTWIQSQYTLLETKSGTSSSSSSSIPHRRVVTTSAQGIHTRAARHPQTTDFGEAMIDWWLLGESDLVITSSREYTFGTTASLRTAVPLVNGVDCTRLAMVQEGLAPNTAAEHI